MVSWAWLLLAPLDPLKRFKLSPWLSDGQFKIRQVSQGREELISGHGLTRAQQFCHIGAKKNFEVEFKLKPLTVLMAIKSVKKPFTEKKTCFQLRCQTTLTLGGIQVLRHHDFDLFWPTHLIIRHHHFLYRPSWWRHHFLLTTPLLLYFFLSL